MKKLTLLSLACALLATGCNSASQSTGNPTVDLEPGAKALELNWHYGEPKYHMIGEAKLLGDLYMKPGTVRAFNIRTRKPAFEVPIIADEGRTSYAEVDGNILIIDRKDTVSLVDKMGNILSSFKLPGEPHRNSGNLGPFVTDTSVYLAAGQYVYQYDRDDLLQPDAEPVWMQEFSKDGAYSTIGALQVLSDDEIVVATNADDYHRLISLRADKSVRWDVEQNPDNEGFADTSTSFIEPYKNTLVTHAYTKGLQAYDRGTGKAVWNTYQLLDTYCAGAGFATHATVVDEKIFIAPIGNKCVMAFDVNTGKNLWTFDSPYSVSFGSKPLYHNDVLYATNGRLWALDADTGKLLGQAREALKENMGTPLAYDPVEDQILTWGGTGIHSYQPLK